MAIGEGRSGYGFVGTATVCPTCHTCPTCGRVTYPHNFPGWTYTMADQSTATKTVKAN